MVDFSLITEMGTKKADKNKETLVQMGCGKQSDIEQDFPMEPKADKAKEA